MKEIRDIKIDMITGSQNPIIELFNQITEGIQIVNCDVYEKHGWEFIYHKDGEWIFYQNLKNEKFWCNYYKYWSFFESQLGLTYLEVQSITKLLVEEALKREVAPTNGYWWSSSELVEEALKREVAPPKSPEFLKLSLVEEALKREVVPPGISGVFPNKKVEEALKRELVPPIFLTTVTQ